MRDRETIDSELRLLAAQRRSIRERGGELSSRQLDALLDERLGHHPQVPAADTVKALKTKVVAADWSQRETNSIRPSGRKSARRRFSLVAALPLSLAAVAAAVMVMFAARNPDPAAQTAEVPPSAAQPKPTPPPAEIPLWSAQPKPAAPTAHASSVDIVDRAFVEALKQEGVPIPSREYVMSQGHAVCDFLARQPNFTDAVAFVQRSSTWDANQSADVAVGAIVSYCPQYEPAASAAPQQSFQNALSDLQAIEGDLQRIRDGLPSFPSQH